MVDGIYIYIARVHGCINQQTYNYGKLVNNSNNYGLLCFSLLLTNMWFAKFYLELSHDGSMVLEYLPTKLGHFWVK